ncbi:MAG: DUF1080 domain-containing protein [Bryobacteraceae bacterium]
MNKSIVVLLCGALAGLAQKPGQKDPGPQPRYVQPGDAAHAPSDAVALFDGKDMSAWQTEDGKTPGCQVSGGVMACTSGVGNMFTKAKMRDVQIHLEFLEPKMPEQHGQLRGNSGVYLGGAYELQILDSYRNPTYANGVLGALYAQAPPLVNVARAPGNWESYDIIYHPLQCDGAGNVTKKGTVTALLNGVLVQDHVTIENTKGGCDAAPLMLQDHSGFKGAPVTTMRFRNIWYRPLGQ